MGHRSRVAEQVDAEARTSGWLARAVRAGLVSYGVVHLLLAWVAVRLTFSDQTGAATGTGALAQFADADVLGRWSLAAMAVAFGALVIWQLLAMAFGYRGDAGWQRKLMRAGAASRAVVYAYFAQAAAGVALHGSSEGGQSPRSMTARVLDAPAGPIALILVGCVVAAVGIGLALFGWRQGFEDQLDAKARNSGRRTPILWMGRIGYVAKGTALMAVGGLLVWAALTHDSRKSGGLDRSLYLLLGDEVGRIAVLLIGAGIGCFGLYLFARARHLDLDRLTS